MNNKDLIEILKWFATVFGSAAAVYGVIRAAGITHKAQIEAKQTVDKTQIEVTHIQAQNEYTDNLREDIQQLKVEVADLRKKLEESNEKWFTQQREILDKQRQINEQESKIREQMGRITALETDVVRMRDDGMKTRQDCQEEIARQHDEIVALQERCRVVESERDELKAQLDVLTLAQNLATKERT